MINFIKIQNLVNFRIRYNDSNLRKEPKFVVFFTQLLALFKFCHACKHDRPLVEVAANGTMAEVTSTCGNCGNTSKWFSQPNMTGTKIPAGNFLLSYGILVAGTSATKVLRVFHHMGLKCIALSTYFAHQRVGLVMIFNNKLHELLNINCIFLFAGKVNPWHLHSLEKISRGAD